VHYKRLEDADGDCFDAVAAKLTRSFSMSPASAHGVRHAVLRTCDLSNGGAHSTLARRCVLVVLRGGTRRLYNSAALVALLRTWAARGMLGGQPLPVRVVDAGIVSFCEQVAAFAAARLVVGFSGADLTNAIFMQDDALLIELFTVDFYTTHYAWSTPADAAAIDVLVWTRMRTSSPEQCAGLHELPLDDVTLVTSASQPFVAGAHVSEDTRRKLSEGLLALHEGSGSADGTMTLEGRVGLSHVRRFARVTDRDYDSTRLVLRASASVEISHKIVGEAPGASGETGNAAAESAPAAEEAMSVKRSSRFC